jgi:hypothetical protein
MSYPAICPPLPCSLAPLAPSPRNPADARKAAAASPWAPPPQLVDWLRLAARRVLAQGLLERLGRIERIEPYRACTRCVFEVSWCGEGIPPGPPTVQMLPMPPIPAMHPMQTMRKRLQPRSSASCRSGDPCRQGLHGITPLTSSLVIGAHADPYPAAEAVRESTRGLLAGLLRAGVPATAGRSHTRTTPAMTERPETLTLDRAPEITGLEISILTRSPLLLRDLDLLVQLDRRHVVTVSVLIPAAEAKLARRLESHAPPSPRPSFSSFPRPVAPPCFEHPSHFPHSPDTRFELVRTLAAHGIAVEVLCTPVVPGLNNGVAALRRLLDLAHQAGACDVRPAPRHPALQPTDAESRHLLALFHRLRLERGFPRTLPGRG